MGRSGKDRRWVLHQRRPFQDCPALPSGSGVSQQHGYPTPGTHLLRAQTTATHFRRPIATGTSARHLPSRQRLYPPKSRLPYRRPRRSKSARAAVRHPFSPPSSSASCFGRSAPVRPPVAAKAPGGQRRPVELDRSIDPSAASSPAAAAVASDSHAARMREHHGGKRLVDFRSRSCTNLLRASSRGNMCRRHQQPRRCRYDSRPRGSRGNHEIGQRSQRARITAARRPAMPPEAPSVMESNCRPSSRHRPSPKTDVAWPVPRFRSTRFSVQP